MSYFEGLTGFMDGGSLDLDHEFLFNMDLDPNEQTCMDEMMSDNPISWTIEEEVSLLQDDGLLDLADHSSLPCKLGIEAQDLGSLLDQFEEASQTLGDCDFLEPTINFFSNEDDDKSKDENEETSIPVKKELTDAVIQKLRTSTKQKSTVMLPLAVPAKRGRGRAMTRGHPVGLPSNCTPRRLQRVMQQNEEFKDSLSFLEPEPEKKSKKTSEAKRKTADTEDVTVDVDDNYFNLILDHDYPKNVANPKVEPVDSEGDKKLYDDVEEGELVEDEEGEETDNVDKEFDKFKKISDKSIADRNYRKRSGSPEIETDSSLYFDKLPSYYTALSIPRKQIKKTASSSCVGRGGISVHDYIERDRSPVRDNSMYNKLPDYHSSFTNSTRYDSLILDTGKSCEDSKLSSGYSSLTHSPERSSRSRSRSSSYCSRSSPRPSRRSSKRRSSYSPFSRYSSSRSRSCSRSSCDGSHSSRSSSSSSSSSCSTCDSRSSSRSRSRSPVSRSWQREHNRRRERSRTSRRRSRGHYRSRSRSVSRSASRSASWRYRSRSRDVSSKRNLARERSLSKERWRQERKQQREDEKKRQMKDRRIVYVGGLPNNYTRRQLRDGFKYFGEVETVQLHFREHGDNYGFVTFVYTCDAFAAIEKGKTVPELENFDLCFGGRRQFCDVEYADLDGNKEIEEEYESKPPGAMDFDELLKQARMKIKKS